MSNADDEDLTLDQEWVDGVFSELGDLELILDPDPLIFGPKRLNGKVAEARNLLRRCEAIYLQVSHDLHRFSRALRVATTKLKLSKDYLFANDPETRAGRNVADRDAIAAMKLQSQLKEVHRLEISVEDLKSLLTVVKAKRSDLRDTQGRLRDQIRLCQEELGLGGRWGSRLPNAPDIDADKSPSASMDDIEKMLQTVEGEFHLGIPGVTDDEDEAEEEALLIGSADEEDEEETEEDTLEEDSESEEEDEEAEETEGGNEHLEPSATIEDVDAFLSDDDFPAPAPKAKTPAKPSGTEDSGLDDDLDTLLSAFD